MLNKIKQIFEPFMMAESPESEKIKESTQFLDTTKMDKTQEYSFVEKTLNTNYEIRPLKSAKVSGEKLSDLYRSTMLLGGGTHFSSVSNITYNSVLLSWTGTTAAYEYIILYEYIIQ